MNKLEQERFQKIRGLTFMAVLSERVKWHRHQIEFVEEIIQILKQEKDKNKLHPDEHLHRDLTKMEKNLLNVGFKGLLTKQREEWRTINEIYRGLQDDLDRLRRDLSKAQVLEQPKVIEKAEAGIEATKFKIRLCKFQINKIETEVLETIQWGLGVIDEVVRVGQQHKNLCSESKIFYAKMECDFYRYLLEIMLQRSREAKADEEDYPD